MDRTTLHKIFEKAYNHQDWIEILQSVFGARQLYAQPKPILLPNNERATEAFELGSFTTSDDRIIGLYRINVKSDVWLERNKVSLRELLRKVYDYDVDGAIVVFVQDEKWRLSFISEIKVLNDEGEIIKQATEPKRYTYLLGKDEKVRTPSDRLSKLTGKTISLQDMLNAFSVEALNEEFYKIVQSFFYELVGGKIGKGKKVTDYKNGILQLPHTDRSVRQEFAVRLIGRTVFCWFLKMKKSDDDIALLPENLLSSDAVKHYNNYYHTILERLFFQTLNTPMEERLSNLPEGTNTVPFLNGGLFEPNIEDYYKPDSKGNIQNHFGISDDWFLRFFGELEKYNFTIDENSVTEIEISVDPEMLGRIFENLLAEIDPDSGETARKATGSFYTPREIVDYMATESLVQYLNNQTGIVQDKLRPIFKMLETAAPEFTEAEKNNILDALDKIKILDPACGSGAFPMGVLQKIVQALQKLDPEAEWWKKRQIDRIKNPTVKKLLKEKLSSSGVEYARKIGVIQNSLYGVDIQPVAAEISKLRCFLSLVVDENIDDNRPNRGVEPLPNLEFKFVTADTLLNLPNGNEQRNMFDNFDELQELEELRNEYIQSYGKAKKSIKDKFLKVQQKIAKDQNGLWGDSESKAYKLGNWDPFGNRKANWFDPKWMFGFEEFDIVIGNPPYGVSIKGDYRKDIIDHLGKVPDFEIYYYFIEKAHLVLKDNGILSYIIPNTYLFNTYATDYRQQIVNKWNIDEILDCTKFTIFQSATVRNTINLWSKDEQRNSLKIGYRKTKNIKSFKDLILKPRLFIDFDELLLMNQNWGLAFMLDNLTVEIINLIKKDNPILNDFYDVSQGYIPYRRSDLIKKYGENEGNKIVDERLWHSDTKLSKDYIPEIFGRDLNRFGIIDKQKTTYVKYGKHLAGYVDIKFFNQKRLLVREITNPRIIATIIEEEYVNDPQLISIIKKTDLSLEFLWAILNSKLATFYHFNFSPKATKGDFPKILVKDIKEFPLAMPNDTILFETIVEYLIFLKTLDKESLDIQLKIAYLQQVIDGMVYELYFTALLQQYQRTIAEHLGELPSLAHLKEESEKMNVVETVFNRLNYKTHPVRNNLFFMKNIKEIALIEGINQ